MGIYKLFDFQNVKFCSAVYCFISISTNVMAALGVIQSRDIWVTWLNATLLLVPFGIGLTSYDI